VEQLERIAGSGGAVIFASQLTTMSTTGCWMEIRIDWSNSRTFIDKTARRCVFPSTGQLTTGKEEVKTLQQQLR
jgi:hypothetical protein